jgi:hypothetical protein
MLLSGIAIWRRKKKQVLLSPCEKRLFLKNDVGLARSKENAKWNGIPAIYIEDITERRFCTIKAKASTVLPHA